MRKVCDRPDLITRSAVEQYYNTQRKPEDTQANIKEQSSKINRRHQVLQVTMGTGDRFKLCLQLTIDGLQLLVDRLQFLLACLQLFGGRTVFLVDRLKLFV